MRGDNYSLLFLGDVQEAGQTKTMHARVKTLRQAMPAKGLPKDPGFVVGITHDRDGKLSQALAKLGRQADDVCFLRVEEGKKSWRFFSTHGNLTTGDSGGFSKYRTNDMLGMMERELQRKRLKSAEGLPEKPMQAFPEDVLVVGDFSHFLNPEKVIEALYHLFRNKGVERCEFVDYSAGS